MTELKESLDYLISSVPLLLFQFGDDSCGPCHAIRYKLDKWLEGHSDVTARYVDIPFHLELCSQMGIFSAPTVIAYIDGALAAWESGYFSLEELLDRIERYMEMKD